MWKASNASSSGAWRPLEDLPSPTVISSASYVAYPSPLQRADPLSYVGYTSSLSDHRITDHFYNRISRNYNFAHLSKYKYLSFYSSVVSSASYVACPSPLQRADPLSYVGNTSSLTDHRITDHIPQRHSKHSSLHSTLSDFEFLYEANI